MTVQELIDILQTVPDKKSHKITLSMDDGYSECWMSSGNEPITVDIDSVKKEVVIGSYDDPATD